MLKLLLIMGFVAQAGPYDRVREAYRKAYGDLYKKGTPTTQAMTEARQALIQPAGAEYVRSRARASQSNLIRVNPPYAPPPPDLDRATSDEGDDSLDESSTSARTPTRVAKPKKRPKNTKVQLDRGSIPKEIEFSGSPEDQNNE